MDVLSDFKNNLQLLGLTDNLGNFRPISYTHFIFHGLLVLNLVLFLKTRWDDIDDRFAALKAMAYVITFTGITMAIICFWNDFSQLVTTMDRIDIDIPYKISRKRHEIFMALQDGMRRFNKIFWTTVKIYVTLTSTIPVIIVVVRVTIFSGDFQKIIKENSVVPLPLHYPEYIKNFPDQEWLLNSIVYVTGHTFESFYMLMTGYYAHIAFVIPLSAMANVEFEFKQLALSLTEMDGFLREPNFDNSDDNLRSFLKYLVRHHQNTCRKFKLTSKGVTWIALVYCSITSLYVCMALYAIVQKDQLVLKIQEAVLSAVWINTLFLFCICGESVKTENENFMKALYECTWLDKPIWFKRYLLLMMTHTCRPVDIKPYGLYGFNLNTFAASINAAYCYYNVLCGLKDKN